MSEVPVVPLDVRRPLPSTVRTVVSLDSKVTVCPAISHPEASTTVASS
jgi:hypothetical protein